MILPESFYTRKNVVKIARELLGKVLVTDFGVRTSGIIVETEAYEGINDMASHAYGGKRTVRTEVMYMHGGTSYVFLCYGIHNLFNVVTNLQNTPHAILIRAIEPLEGIDVMLKRRNKSKLLPSLTAGPGALSQALGIQKIHTGLSLLGGNIFIEDRKNINNRDIIETTRVGVAYAMHDALLPYRFYIKDNKFVSKGKGL